MRVPAIWRPTAANSAARRWCGWSAGTLLVLDIGGGSLEIAIGMDEEPDAAISVPLGAGRVTTDLLPGDPPTAEVIKAAISAQAAQDGGSEYTDARRLVGGDINGDGTPDVAALYSLEGALCGCHWQEVPEARRNELVAAAEAAIAQLPPPRGRPAAAPVHTTVNEAASAPSPGLFDDNRGHDGHDGDTSNG